MPENAMNIEAVAYQFGWDFYYPDASVADKHVAVPEATKDDPEISLPGAPRQTKVLMIPVGRQIVMHVTAQDVIHAFFVPHLGTKIDAIPGRINYAWFTATEPGEWLGQCAELCGQAHGEMFFRVKAVPQAEFDAWLAQQRTAAGIVDEVSGTTVSGTVVTGAEGISGTVTVPAKKASVVQQVAAAVSATAEVKPAVVTSPSIISGSGIMVPTAN
jgi:heme/copper-type cytochrome/quinol oxidase subunit 2